MAAFKHPATAPGQSLVRIAAMGAIYGAHLAGVYPRMSASIVARGRCRVPVCGRLVRSGQATAEDVPGSFGPARQLRRAAAG